MTRPRERLDRWVTLARLLREGGAGIVTAGLVLAVITGLLPIAFIVLTARVLYLVPVAAAGEGWSAIAPTFAGAVAVLVVQQAVAPFQGGITETIARRVDQVRIDRLLSLALADAPVSALEDPESRDILADARAAFDRQQQTPGDAASALLALTVRYTQLLGAVVLIAVVVNPLAGIVIGATALAMRFGARGTFMKLAPLWNIMAGQRRKMTYLRELATSTRATKDIRLLGLSGWLRARLHSETLRFLEPQWATNRRLQFWPYIGFSAVGFTGGTLVLVLVAVDTARGGLDLFAVGVALQAILIPLRFGAYFPEADMKTQFGLFSFTALRRFEEKIDAAVAPAPAPSATTAPLHGTIRFENVSFRYRPDLPWVVRHLDLELPAGRSTAIVGLNGAGKTTLVKLLARLYEPTEGRITVDGSDIAGLPVSEWQRHLAVIFQDYVHYELPLSDNIGFGAPHLLGDRDALLRAAHEAGADVVLDRLGDDTEDGAAALDTVLSSGYPGGRDLSGGQWQRIALARALFAVAGGSRVLVLDEPTAQLDVRAEAEFFDRFLASGAVDAASGGEQVTSVVISHRFSTVRPADQIVVIADGAVVESGNHDTLVAAGGRYAQLFELQAQQFRDDTETALEGALR